MRLIEMSPLQSLAMIIAIVLVGVSVLLLIQNDPTPAENPCAPDRGQPVTIDGELTEYCTGDPAPVMGWHP